MQRIIFATLVCLMLLGSWLNYRDTEWGSIQPVGSFASSAEGRGDEPPDGSELYGPFPEHSSPAGAGNYYGPGLYAERFVNEAEEGRMSHVSSMAPLDGGDMMAAWYSGSREGAGDVTIYASKFSKGKWGHPVALVSRRTHMEETGRYVKKVGNALLSRDESGRIWLFYSTVFAGGWSGASLNYKYSEDGGDTWSMSARLVLSPLFNLTNNVKNKAMALRGGGLLLPVYHELLRKRSELVRLYPDGRFSRVIMTKEGEAIQPSLVRKEGGTLGAFYRNMFQEYPRKVLYSESSDMGRNWGPLLKTTLNNPNAGLDVVNVGKGLIAVLNNVSEGRDRLTLEYSADGGRTWDELRVLEQEKGKEFSYPTIAMGTDGIMHVTYTYERKRIKHVSFDRLWLGAMTGGTDG